MKGKIYLIPTPLGDVSPDQYLGQDIKEMIRKLRYFAVEEIRTARRFLRKVDRAFDIDGSTFFELNKRTSSQDIPEMLEPLLNGNDLAIISEAGMPCIADPGSLLVMEAHKNTISVIPVPGPSSIFLALAASGMNGQRFAFHGYLPIQDHERKNKIRLLETEARKEEVTQIFMETPYRNQAILENLLSVCHPDTLLCIAADINLSTEYIKTLPVSLWKKERAELHKRPAIFLLSAPF
jgi:16S rRNA (cytidine1402-2'-O)-methyltransferase